MLMRTVLTYPLNRLLQNDSQRFVVSAPTAATANVAVNSCCQKMNHPTFSNTESRNKYPTKGAESVATTDMHTESTPNAAGCIIGGSGAFLPYRPQQSTVLTNLQRGNTTATFVPTEVQLSFHERIGQGEITEEQLCAEIAQHENEQQGTGVNFKDSAGFASLHWAAHYGQLHTVQMLLKHGANVNIEAPEMVRPLHLAAAGGHHEVVRLLIEEGAVVQHMDILGNTALMYAAAGNNPHTCHELLLKEPDFTLTNEDGENAYTLAIKHNATLAQAVLEQHIQELLTL